MTSGMLLADRYELVQELGRGGMGRVWLAVDRVLDRRVAVKTVDLDASRDPVAAERFQREAKAAAALSHDNVVTVFDSGTDGSTAFMVMQLLSGPTLDDVIRDRAPLPLTEALALAEQTAAALAATHRIGIVHRDIKPGNLMFDDQGRLKVVDFGIARLTETMSAQLTAPSTVVGSAAYMAPEQAKGEAATPATDLYALGCVLTALLTGRPPFEAEHPMGVLQQHLTAAPPRLRDRRSDIPASVDGLVDELLAKDPALRPSDAGEVAARLRTLRAAAGTSAGTLPMPAAPTVAGTAEAAALTREMEPVATVATRVLPPAAAVAPTAVAPVVAPRTRRVDRRMLAGLGVAVVLALLLLLLPPLLSGIGQDADPAAEPAPPEVSQSATAESSAADQPVGPEPAEPEPVDPAPADPEPVDTEPAPVEQGQEQPTSAAEAPVQEQPASAAVTPAQALSQLRAAIDSAAGSDEGGGADARESLRERVADVEERLADGRTEDMPGKLEELVRRVDELEREDKLAAESAAAIRQAVAQLAASLAAGP